MDESRRAAPADPELLVDWQTPLLVQAVNAVGLGDLLAQQPRTVEEIGAATGWQPTLVARVLRALAPRRLFACDHDGRWSLTEAGRVLSSDHPASVARARFSGFEVGGWARMLHTLRTGESSFERTFGMGFWEYLDQHPEDRAAFDEKMRRRLPTMLAMVEHYPWPTAGHVVDVGGGTGTLLLAILGRAPGLTGTLVDVPETIAAAQDVVARSPSADRCRLLAGDFFAPLPPGADLYVLSQIVHDWPDDDAVRILENVRTAMPADGRVLLLEGVLPEEDRLGLAMLDVHMLAMFGSGERDHDQWTALLARAGLRLERVIGGDYVSWIEAVPA